MRNTRHITIFAVIFLLMASFGANAYAAAPTWTPITGNEYNMIGYGSVTADGNNITSAGYIIGAFGPGGDSDCRAVANIGTDSSWYLTIRSNSSSGETITFKVYDPNQDAVLRVNETVPFADGTVANKNLQAVSHGDPTQFVVVNPTDGTVDAGVTVTIQLQDANGAKVTANSTATVTVNVSGSAKIDGGGSAKQVTMTNGQATVSVTDQSPETVNITLSSGSGGYATSSSQDLVFGVGALATLTVSPDTKTLTADETQQFTVAGADQYGNAIASPGTVTWGGTGVVSGNINTSGLFTAKTTGTGTVTATIGSVSDSSGTITVTGGALATLTVNPSANLGLTADQTQQFAVQGFDADGNTVTVDAGSITWAVTGDIGAVSTSGLFSANKVGTGTVTATVGAVSNASGTITVSAGKLATLTVSPNEKTLTADETQQFTVTGVDADGNTAALGNITWSGSGVVNGHIDNTGLFTAVGAGTGTVTATSDIDNVVGTSGTITVTAGALATLTVSPDTLSVSADVNDTQFSVAGVDADGNTVTNIGTITWSSSDTNVGFISNSGVFEAKKVGTTTVTATSSLGPSDTSGTITVTKGALATLTVDPDTKTVTADETIQFTVSGVDADGNALAAGDLGTIAWSGGTGIGTIDPATGLFTATTVGTGSVRATSSLNNGGIFDISGDISVTPGAAVGFTFESNKPKVASGGKGTATLTAKVVDADNNVKTNDVSRTINLAVTGAGVANAGWTTNTITTTNGVGTVDFTTTGTVPAPGSTTVTVTASTTGLADKTVNLEIVNFSINVTAPAAPMYNAGTGIHLVVAGGAGPHTATLAGVGGDAGSYRWAHTGVGGISSTIADTITFTAPTSITGATQQATITLTHATDQALTDTITVTVYNPVTVTYPTSTIALVPGDTSKTVTVTGGTGTYAMESQNTGVAVVSDTGQITAVAAGITTAKVRDATYGDYNVANGFLDGTAGINVVNPIVIGGTPASNAMASGTTNTFTATGGLTGNVIWSASAGSITQGGVFTAPTIATGSQQVTITAHDATYNASYPTPIKTDYQVTVFGALTVTPNTPVGIVVGGTYDFTASGGNAAGGDNTWTSSDTTIGTVAEKADDVQATFTAVKAGTATVTVKDDRNLTASSGTITVVDPIVIGGKPANDAMSSGANNTFTTTGGTGSVVWSASDGTITQGGVFTAPTVATGSQQVTITAYDATFNSTHNTPIKTDYQVTVYSTLTIAPSYDIGVIVGGTVDFAAAGGNSGGDNAWTSSNNAVGTVAEKADDIEATFTAAGTGTATVTVTDDKGLKATSGTITVVNDIVIGGTPANNAMPSEGTNTFTFTGGSGTVIWSASAGSITQAGVFTAPTVPSGSQQVTITAYDGTFNSSHNTPIKKDYVVTVFGALAITPSSNIGLKIGDTQTFTASGGDTATGVKSWTLVNETQTGGSAVGAIVANTPNTTAVFTAQNTGTVSVKVTDNSDLTVVSGVIEVIKPVAIANAPTSNNLSSAATFDFNATGGKQEGVVKWSATSGTIDADTGVYTPAAVIAATQVTITAADATYSSITATVTITVYPPLAVTVDDADSIVLVGKTATFTAAGGLGNGVNWTATKGTISTAGLFTAAALTSYSTPETVTVTATDKTDANITATKQVKVANAIIIWADDYSVAAGGTTKINVKGGDMATYTTPTVAAVTGSAGTLSNKTNDGVTTTWDFTAANEQSSSTVTIADANAATDATNFRKTSQPVNVFAALSILTPQASLSGKLLVGDRINLVATGGSGSYTWSVKYKANSGDAYGTATAIQTEMYSPTQAGYFQFTVTDGLLAASTTNVEVQVLAALTISEADPQVGGKYKFITAVGDTNLLTLTATGGNTAGGTVTWTSGSTAVATVTVDPADSTKATVNPVAPGFTRITATDVSGFKGTFNVKVVAPLTVAPTAATVRTGSTATLTPSGGAFSLTDHLAFASSATADATVAKNGLTGVVTAVDPGTVTITVTDSTPGLKNNLTAQATITVPSAAIAGTVVNGAGATVSVSTSADFSSPATGTADAAGAFSIDVPAAGTYYVKAALGNQAGVYPNPVVIAAGELKTGIAITMGEGLQIAVDPAGTTAITDGVPLNLFAVGGLAPYTWSVNAGSLDATNKPNVVFTDGTMTAGDQVTITLTDSTPGTPLTQTKTLTVLTALTVTADKAAYNVGDTVTLTINGGTAGGTKIITSSNSGVIAGSTATMSAVGAGEATITVADAQHPLFTATVTRKVSAAFSDITPTSGTYTTATDGTPIVAAGDKITFGITGGSGSITWSADNGATISAAGEFTAPSTGAFAKIYTVTAKDDNTGATKTFQVGVPVKITPTTWSWVEGGAAKQFTASGLAGYKWSVIQGLNTTADHTVALSGLTGDTTATATATPSADVAQTTPFRLEVNNTAGDLDARLVGRTNNLTVINTRKLTGTVYDVFQSAIDGTALTSTSVKTLDGTYSTTIAADGTFSITVPDVPGVAYRLRVAASGYVTQTINESSLPTVVLQSAGGSITGTITTGGAAVAPNVTAYITVWDGSAWVKKFVDTPEVAASGAYTIWYKDYGQYTVVASRPGYARGTLTVSVTPAAPNATGQNMTLAQQYNLQVSTNEVYDSTLQRMVTKILVAGVPALTAANEVTVALKDLDLDGDGVTDTTNYGTLSTGTFAAASGVAPAHVAFTYTPIVGDDKIGITVAGANAAANARTIDMFFFVNPEQTSQTDLGSQTNPVDGDTGGTGNLDGLDTNGDGVPDTAANIGYEIPAGSLVDPNPDDNNPLPTVIDVLVGAEQGTGGTFASNFVEVTLVDTLGRDLKDSLGDVVSDTSPIIIKMTYDPEKFDLTNYSIFYRERNADGSWGAWVDGVADGSITVISIDPTNNTITFSTTHLSGFGVGSVVSSITGGGGGSSGGGGGCFITTATDGLTETSVGATRSVILFLLAVVAMAFTVVRRK